MPGLEIRYLGFNTNDPSVKSKAVRQAMAAGHQPRRTRLRGVRHRRRPAVLAWCPTTVTGHANSFFNKYGEPDTAKAKALLSEANVTTPVKLTLHYTDRPLRRRPPKRSSSS